MWRESNQDGRDGVFLGVSDRTDELYVGTERDMHKFRTLRRGEATERVDLIFLECCVGEILGWPKSAKDVRVVWPDVSSLAAMAEAEAIGKARRLYINKGDIMKHGLTEGCLGCRSFTEGARAQGHSRLEAEIAKSDGLAKAFERVSLPVVWAWATHFNLPRKILRVLCVLRAPAACSV